MAEPLIEIKIDEHKLERIQKMLRNVPRAMPKVVSRAINKTAGTSKVEIARKITAQVKMKISDVKKGIKIYKASYTKWQATLDLLTRRIPLIKFGARQVKKGVSYQISKTEGRKTITEAPGPFIGTMRSGHIGVFRRKGKERLPIIQLFGPSIGGVFEGATRIAIDVQADSTKTLERNLDSQVKYILSRSR